MKKNLPKKKQGGHNLKIAREEEKLEKCQHTNCQIVIDTKSKRGIHHDKCDPECKMEKHSVIRMITKFKKSIDNISFRKPTMKNKEIKEKVFKLLENFTETHKYTDLSYLTYCMNYLK